MNLHIVKIVNVQASICHFFDIDACGKASPHYVFDYIKLPITLVLEYLEVLFTVKIFPRQRYDQLGIEIELALFFAKEIKTDLKAKSADIELATPDISIWCHCFAKEIMFDELCVAQVNRILWAIQ